MSSLQTHVLLSSQQHTTLVQRGSEYITPNYLNTRYFSFLYSDYYHIKTMSMRLQIFQNKTHLNVNVKLIFIHLWHREILTWNYWIGISAKIGQIKKTQL